MLLFDAIESFQIDSKNIHEIREELTKMVHLGRDNKRLRIITQFLSALEALATVYEFDDAESIAVIKSLIRQSFKMILDMAHNSATDSVQQLDTMLVNAFALLKHKHLECSFICEPTLIKQLSLDIVEDITNIQHILSHNYSHRDFEMSCYYLKRLYKFIHLIGITNMGKVIYELLIELDRHYKNNNWHHLGSEQGVLIAFSTLKKFALYINEHSTDQEAVETYLSQHPTADIIKKIHISPQPTQSTPIANLLSDEEINALMKDDFETVVSFDKAEVKESPSVESQQTPPIEETPQEIFLDKNSQRIELEGEDKLIELAGKLFLKQEQLKTYMGQHASVSDDFKEIDELSSNLKQILFDQYYITIGELLGEELRVFVRKEVKGLGKKIRLGVSGEHTEILAREGDFVKHIIFNLVHFSLTHSIEFANRRRAFDKSDTGLLLIEFDDSTDYIHLSVRDDGKGIGEGVAFFEKLRSEIEAKQGIIEIDSEENEYLKINIQLPMKKVITKSLVATVSGTKVLIPTRCVEQVITQKDISLVEGISQIALFNILGINRSAVNVYVLCRFGSEKILFGVEQVLYELEALGEDVDVPLIPCSSAVVIVKDGTVGFLLDEKKLYAESRRLIQKRTDAFLAL